MEGVRYRIVYTYEDDTVGQEELLNLFGEEGWRVIKTWLRYSGVNETRYFLLEKGR